MIDAASRIPGLPKLGGMKWRAAVVTCAVLWQCIAIICSYLGAMRITPHGAR